MIPPRRRPFMNRTGDSQPRHLSRTVDRCHIQAMRKPIFAMLMLFAAATAIGRPAAKAGEPPSAGLELAMMATQVTGIAISPLLGVSTVGDRKAHV